MVAPAPNPGAYDDAQAVTFTLHACRCDEPILERLIAAVRQGTSPAISVTAVWQDIRIRRGDLAAIRAAIAVSLDPRDQRRLNRLELAARNGDRRALVVLDGAVTVTVESADGAWALGRAEQIRRILEHAGGREEPRRWRPWRWAAVAGATAGVAAVALWMAGVLGIVPGTALAVGAAAAGYLVGRRFADRHRPVIWIDGALPRTGWRQWSRGDRIASLTFVVAVLGLIVPFLAK